MVMPSECFMRLANARDGLLMQRSAWADRQEFLIAEKLRLEAISIIEDGFRDWAFLAWKSKEQAAGRRYESDASAYAAYRSSARAPVSVLFARSDSCYFDQVDDVWDVERDARRYVGTNPVVCHPPCRGWGRLRHWAKPRPDEKALAIFAVEQVRRCGGVLEHPWGSTLWKAAQLPLPGHGVDAWGGWTLLVDQGWWGHAAPKPTYLYIVGITRDQVGELPVQLRRAAGRTLELSPADRERTPPLFAKFLVGLAAKCAGSQLQPPAAAVTPSCSPSAVAAVQAQCYTGLAAVTAGQDRKKNAASKRAAFASFARAL